MEYFFHPGTIHFSAPGFDGGVGTKKKHEDFMRKFFKFLESSAIVLLD